MKVLIIGSRGQVGSALVSELSATFEVVAADRSKVDLARSGEAARFISDHDPEVVINAAAWTKVDAAEAHPEAVHRVNAEAVAEIAAAARSGWLVHYSTDYVFDGQKEEPYTELDATAPLSVYGRSKRDGERAASSGGGRHLVLRTSWVHAPGHPNFATTILRLASERDSLRVVRDQVGIPTSAQHIARMTRLLLHLIVVGRQPDSGIYHLTSAGSTSWYDYARFVVESAGAKGAALRCGSGQIEPVTTEQYPTAASRPKNSKLSTRKLESLLGIQMPHWQPGVLDTIHRSQVAVQ